MASLSQLLAERGRLIDQIAEVTALLTQDRRELAKQQSNLSFATNERDRQRINSTIAGLNARIDTNTRRLSELEQQLAQVNEQIRRLQDNEAGTAANRQSSAQTVAEAQTAGDDGASPTRPPPVALVSENGRVVPEVNNPASNAVTFVPQSDAGTNAPGRNLAQTQSTPPITANPGPAQTPGSFGSNVRPGNTAGTGTGNDDSAKASGSVRGTLNRIFAGSTGRIIEQPNYLDQYASYTYNLSLYLITADQYARLMRDKTRDVSGFTLLMKSGGAPLANPDQTGTNGQTDPGEIPGVTTRSLGLGPGGRSQFFPLDYYMDDLRFSCYAPGKGSGGAHNVSRLSFVVREPNGITFLDNLYRATQQFATQQGVNEMNYAAQVYLLAVRFYGYDQNGNLVSPGRSGADSAGNPSPVIEKFIPFHFSGIKFRISNRIVEYDCQAVAIQVDINQGNRGVIPYDVEIPARTLKDLLSGNPALATSKATGSEGRPAAVPGQQADIRRVDNAIAATQNQTLRERYQGLTNSTINAELGIPDEDITIDAGNAPTQNTAPPKAGTAPSPKVVYGLMEAMNRYNAEMVQTGKFEHPDRYFMVFSNSILENAEVVPPGPIDKKSKPMIQTQDPAQAKLGSKQSVSNDAKTTSARAGMSIVQFIDQYTRTSSYITEQQIKIPTTDAAGKTTFIAQVAQPGQVVGWYRIGMEAVPTRYDRKRQDYAYDITYQLSPYKINSLENEYFPNAQYQGVHKKYNYWFTGENTSVLKLEIDFNYLYFLTINSGQELDQTNTTNKHLLTKRAFQSRNNESSQGISGRTNDPSAGAADYLYSPADQGRIKFEIVGDPAWIQQGEVWAGIAGTNFNYEPFLSDGTINFDAQEALFEILFNKPQDYDLTTGIADVSANNYGADRARGKPGEAAQTYVYKLRSVVNNFSKGRFTQDIEGVLVNFELPGTSASSDTARSATISNETRSAFLDGPDESAAETQRLRLGAEAITARQPVPIERIRRNLQQKTNNYIEEYGDITDPEAAQFQSSTQSPTQPPTSGGQVVGSAASGSAAVRSQGGASGQNVGREVYLQLTLPGQGTVNIISQAQIDALRDSGQIDATIYREASIGLSQKQQAANSPVTNQSPQLIAKENG